MSGISTSTDAVLLIEWRKVFPFSIDGFDALKPEWKILLELAVVSPPRVCEVATDRQRNEDDRWRIEDVRPIKDQVVRWGWGVFLVDSSSGRQSVQNQQGNPASIDQFVSTGGFDCFFCSHASPVDTVRNLFKGEPSCALCPGSEASCSSLWYLFPLIDSLNTVVWSVVITQQIIVQIKHFYPCEIIHPQPVSFIQNVRLLLSLFLPSFPQL